LGRSLAAAAMGGREGRGGRGRRVRAERMNGPRGLVTRPVDKMWVCGRASRPGRMVGRDRATSARSNGPKSKRL
jgi:hypothetical protein